MGTITEDDYEEGVEFTVEDELVTARDIKSGVAASGTSKSDALAMLAEALELYEGGGEPIEDEDEFLREVGIAPESIDEDQTPPPWLEQNC